MPDKLLQTLESLQTIVNNLDSNLGGYKFLFYVKEYNKSPYLQIEFEAPCSITGKLEKQICRKWVMQYTMSTSEVVRTGYKAAMAAFEHECQEEFKYKGVPVYSPHTDVESLVTMRKLSEYSDDVRIPLENEPVTLEKHLEECEGYNFGIMLHTCFRKGLVDIGWAELMYDAIDNLPDYDRNNFYKSIHDGMKHKADVDNILELFMAQTRIGPISKREDVDKQLRTFTQLCGLITESNAKMILNWFRFCYEIPEPV